jgi:hypothetical protein
LIITFEPVTAKRRIFRDVPRDGSGVGDDLLEGVLIGPRSPGRSSRGPLRPSNRPPV